MLQANLLLASTKIETTARTPDALPHPFYGRISTRVVESKYASFPNTFQDETVLTVLRKCDARVSVCY